MNNTSYISGLNNELKKILDKEIGNQKCCLLDLPNYYNPGDQLIWEGEIQLLRSLGINVTYKSSIYFFDPSKIKPNTCILLQGGGNFGDLYPKHQKFRQYIVNKFPKNKIIILPQTIHFSSPKSLKKCVQSFSYHRNLVIFARDTSSYKLLKNNFIKNTAYLAPDMAFGITSIKPQPRVSKGRILLLHRQDNELGHDFKKYLMEQIPNLEVFDWPQFNKRTQELLVHQFILKTNIFILNWFKMFGRHWNNKYDIFGIIPYHSKDKQIAEAVNFLKEYDLVISTRLHGHILSCLMGIPTIILDNSYGKNLEFYKTWMNDNPYNSYYANSKVAVKNILLEHFPKVKFN